MFIETSLIRIERAYQNAKSGSINGKADRRPFKAMISGVGLADPRAVKKIRSAHASITKGDINENLK
jgi:hypothetical protein